MKFQGNVFVVTGGASGLGGATAAMIVAQGGKVILADVNADAGKAHAASLGAAAQFLKCDVTREEDGKAVIDAALAAGTLRGLVNCAGIAIGQKTVGRDGPHPLDAFQRVIMINLVGTFNMIRLAATAMARQDPLPNGERGVIVNTASVAAYDGQVGQAAYSASKGGVVGMTLPIARDLARNGIRNMTIAPGIFGTPMLFSMPQEVQDALAANVPFPSRLGTPADYAKLVHQIVTNDMLNGEVIRLDGAIRLAPK